MAHRAVRILFTLSFVLAMGLPARRAAAGGLEYAGAGATALGRGGAVTARADDPMVLAYNPAGLAELRGTQILLDVNVALMSACVDPIGYYGWGAYDGGKPSRIPEPSTGTTLELHLGDPAKIAEPEKAYYAGQLDTVCMRQNIVPVPQLAFTGRLSEKLGVGFGLIFPGITPQGQWGGEDGVIRGKNGDLRPAPTRYMLLNTGTIGVFPTFGIGYRISKLLRVGAAFEWGMIWPDITTMAVVSSGTSPHNDIVAHVNARDLFVPGATVSVHLVPTDNLDIVAAFKWQDAVRASGDVALTTSIFDPGGTVHTTHDLVVTKIEQKMPWKLRGGVRYASRLMPRPTGTGNDSEAQVNDANNPGNMGAIDVRDALNDERWDVELDVEYQMNGLNDAQRIDYQPGQQLELRDANNMPSFVEFPEAGKPYTVIEKHWKDQISARAGGTYNIFPGMFAVSAGAHYENRGVDPSYMQIDYWPVSRVGLHGGVTFRMFGRTDLVVSYAHIFQETITVGAPPHEDKADIYARYMADPNTKITTIDKHVGTATSRAAADQPPLLVEPPSGKVDGTAKVTQISTRTANGQPPWLINSGKYRSDFDVVAIGVHSHF